MTPQKRSRRERDRRIRSVQEARKRGEGVLEFEGLHRSFGSNRVLDGVGFAVEPGC
jgi:hypothetical protein